jgi:hypothetical protein
LAMLRRMLTWSRSFIRRQADAHLASGRPVGRAVVGAGSEARG